jgi:general secretion pathway protein G
MKGRHAGFTLIELLVVLTVAALLLSIAAPRFIKQTDSAREAALRENLASLRSAIDQFYADKGTYPDQLQQLVQARYLRRIPIDPVTDRDSSWQVMTMVEDGQVVIYDVKSGAPGESEDGSAYGSW